jgi:hypothetical protein
MQSRTDRITQNELRQKLRESDMSEFKPKKKDDQRADEGVVNKHQTGVSPKAQGER